MLPKKPAILNNNAVDCDGNVTLFYQNDFGGTSY